MTDIVERLRVRRNPMLDGEREEAAAEIERLREGERAADDEIERLRGYIAEIEKWKDEGEQIIGPAAEWGPGGNVIVQSSTMFKLGAWWADRPWKRENIPFCASCGKQKERDDAKQEIERLLDELSHCLHLDNHNAVVANLNDQIEHMAVAIENSGSMAFAYKQEQEIKRLRGLLREAHLALSFMPDPTRKLLDLRYRIREALGDA